METRIALLILILATPLCAEGPQFRHKDGKTQQEFENVYQDLRDKGIKSKTKAQLTATTPARAGLIYYCSDCSTDGAVISTGTTRGAFGRISARATSIN